jgi:hypothetical protein
VPPLRLSRRPVPHASHPRRLTRLAHVLRKQRTTIEFFRDRTIRYSLLRYVLVVLDYYLRCEDPTPMNHAQGRCERRGEVVRAG